VATSAASQDVGAAGPARREGVGLLRSEFLFMGRAIAPTEDEQAEAYREIARSLGPAPAPDHSHAGTWGATSSALLPIPKETNPFLGERGHQGRAWIVPRSFAPRFAPSCDHRGQARSSSCSDDRHPHRVRSARASGRGAREVRPPGDSVASCRGPRRAIMAEQFAREADFFSIGT